MGTTATAATTSRPVGALLREWRERRRLSQLALALDAEVSARHVSFLETGRARPSREVVLRPAERLEVPRRERNALLPAASYAPVFPERAFDDPALRAARRAGDLVLGGHEPYPALAVDRHWTLVAANRAVGPLLARVSGELLRPPVNVMRLSRHPDGLAPRIANLLGLVCVGLGLLGGRTGEWGLLRWRATMVGRIEGFRLIVFGLMLVGLGVGWLWQAAWLLVLSLGIGLVEPQESSTIITGMRALGGRAGAKRTGSSAPA